MLEVFVVLLLFDFSVPELGIKPRDSHMPSMLNLNTKLQPSARRFRLMPLYHWWEDKGAQSYANQHVGYPKSR